MLSILLNSDPAWPSGEESYGFRFYLDDVFVLIGVVIVIGIGLLIYFRGRSKK